MKAPPQLDRLSVCFDNEALMGTYPPLGFLPISDAELGNGDVYGLYWPYGREQREPLVCDTLHDQWGLEVAFSSVSVFVDWLDANDWERGGDPAEDRELVGPRYHVAKSKLGDDPEQAIDDLRQICDDFPESAEFWYTLAIQLRRVGDMPSAHATAVRAYASNWAFGRPAEGILRMLQSATGTLNDPVVERSGRLTMTYGGTKENQNYQLLQECIREYLLSETPILGLLLNQNYAYMMSGETISFRERRGFDARQWLDEHMELCEKYLGDTRTRIQ